MSLAFCGIKVFGKQAVVREISRGPAIAIETDSSGNAYMVTRLELVY